MADDFQIIKKLTSKTILRLVSIASIASLTFGSLSGCAATHENIHLTNTSLHRKTDVVTTQHSMTYGPKTPSPAILAEIHSYSVMQPAPQEIPILMYHSISDRPKDTLCVSPAHFALEMKHLYDAGYHTIGFGDLKNAWLNHKPLPAKPVIITFDDGYEDNYKAAYPVLKRYNLRATIFIVTRFVGNPTSLSWKQIHFMDQQGLVQFGSHTVDHLDLSRMSPTQQRYEIQQSKAQLEQQLGHPIHAFCYPSGRYNATTLQLLQQAGFQFAVTTQPGYAALKQGSLTLRRVRVSGDESVATFSQAFL